MTENVDNYRVERDGETVHLYILDIFGEGEHYTFPVKDALTLAKALKKMAKLKS